MFSLRCCGNVLTQIVDTSNIVVDISNVESMTPHVIGAMNTFLKDKQLLESQKEKIQKTIQDRIQNVIQETIQEVIKEQKEVVQEVIKEQEELVQEQQEVVEDIKV